MPLTRLDAARLATLSPLRGARERTERLRRTSLLRHRARFHIRPAQCRGLLVRRLCEDGLELLRVRAELTAEPGVIVARLCDRLVECGVKRAALSLEIVLRRRN